ncbi:MAG: NAD(P)H-hydrate dehydratase [Candidatus Omnitrophica bacterium]|nr:NAD(P)H-hydrate dehydratase [Candidatus Omnitrophota bacterium]
MMTINEAILKFPKRPADSHKGDFGHVLVIAGSAGYTGAAYLTSQAAALSGAGLVTLAVGRSIYDIMAVKLTEVMVKPFFETKDFSLSLLAEKELLNFSQNTTAIAIGPGISQNKETQHLVRNLMVKFNKPIVLDADGINAVAGHADIFKNSKAPIVMTPHPGEMSKLTGKDVAEIQSNRKDIALSTAALYNTVLVLKGHNTIVAGPKGELYENQTGNPGMATGGMGDVLTGIIAGFAAQGLDLFSASVLGVYFHGMAGDAAAKEKSVLSLLATDLLNKLPEVLKTLG